MKSYEHSFCIGQIYQRRKDIHLRFSGQMQGGIATPCGFPLVFLFTSNAGEAYGYKDSFQSDGTFWYTGEGQVGDMQMIRGNSAIAKHHDEGKRLLLYEYLKKDTVRFLGEVEYLGHHSEQRIDREGRYRGVLIFHLGFISPITDWRIEQPPKAYTKNLSKKLSLNELRSIALESVSPDASTEIKRINVARRAEAIRRYALLRSNGACESCKTAAPFQTTTGPFLEVHHVFRLADGGPDHPASVIALCPNCHRRAHYSIDATSFNQELIEWLVSNEPS